MEKPARIKKQPVFGCYCDDGNVKSVLQNYIKIYPNKDIKIFNVPNARVNKYWVGTIESFQHELDIIGNRKKMREYKKSL